MLFTTAIVALFGTAALASPLSSPEPRTTTWTYPVLTYCDSSSANNAVLGISAFTPSNMVSTTSTGALWQVPVTPTTDIDATSPLIAAINVNVHKYVNGVSTWNNTKGFCDALSSYVGLSCPLKKNTAVTAKHLFQKPPAGKTSESYHVTVTVGSAEILCLDATWQ